MNSQSLARLAASAFLLINNCAYVQEARAQDNTNSRCIVIPRVHGYRLDVLVDGTPLRQIRHGSRTYVEAPWDKDFDIRITCPYGSRYLAVASVDGLSIMTGKSASSSDDGYVIEGGAVTIPGFRLNNDNVAHFHFGDRSKSYAKLLGKPTNIGVIGLKIFADASRHHYYPQANDIDDESNPPESSSVPLANLPDPASRGALNSLKKAAPTAQTPVVDQERAGAVDKTVAKPSSIQFEARGRVVGDATIAPDGGKCGYLPPATTHSSLDHDMGTEFGKKTEFLTHEVDFQRGAQVASFAIEYASHEKLVQAGIIPGESISGHPNPFPADSTGCKPPAAGVAK